MGKGRFLPATLLYYIALLYYIGISQKFTSACETLPSSLHIIKEVYGQSGVLERTCEGDAAVTKCEGSCFSKVRPSALSHSGFIKDCQCCRETSLRVREIILPKCYDSDGKTITSGDKQSFTVSLKEPADCLCYKCGDQNVI